MWKAKRSYTKRLQYFKDHVSHLTHKWMSSFFITHTHDTKIYSVCRVQEKEIVTIQAYLKANKARVDYRTLSKSITLLYLMYYLFYIYLYC